MLSDLETAGEDQPALAQLLLRIRRDPLVRLKVVPLFPIAVDAHFFAAFVPHKDFVRPSQLQPVGRVGDRQSLVGHTPWPLLVVAGLLLLVLAANEALCGRVVVPAAERRSS